MCDRTGNCANGDTCQLVLRNVYTGTTSVEHYCKAHLVSRVWEVERDDELTAVDAIRL